MGALVVLKTPTSNREVSEVNVNELVLRLKTISNLSDVEVIKLTIESMLDEISDFYKIS